MKYLCCICFLCFLPSCLTPIELHREALMQSQEEEEEDAELVLEDPPTAQEEMISTFLFGLVSSSKKIKAQDKCPDGLRSIKITKTFLQTLAAVITLGIYIPIKATFICDSSEEPLHLN